MKIRHPIGTSPDRISENRRVITSHFDGANYTKRYFGKPEFCCRFRNVEQSLFKISQLRLRETQKYMKNLTIRREILCTELIIVPKQFKIVSLDTVRQSQLVSILRSKCYFLLLTYLKENCQKASYSHILILFSISKFFVVNASFII